MSAHLQLLYGRTPDELLYVLRDAVKYSGELVAELRISEPGALDRLERFAKHCEGVGRQAMILRQRAQALREVPSVA